MGPLSRSVLLLATASVALASKYKICTDDPLVSITAVEISPVIPGEPLTVTVEGTPQVEIPNSDIEAQVEIYVLGFKLGHATFDFCTEMTGITCPQPANQPFKGQISYVIPEEAPSGVELTTRIEVENAHTGARYACVEVDVKVKARLGRHYEASLPAVTPAMVAAINERATTWTAHVSPRFAQYTIEDARRVAGGTFLKGHKDHVALPARTYDTERLRNRHADNPHVLPAFAITNGGGGAAAMMTDGGRDGDEDGDIPDRFDAREAWPECAAVVGRVRDQSDCGACWAFASTEAFDDRRCIASLKDPDNKDGPDLTVLSAEDTLSCCKGLMCGFSMGCNGGQPAAAWLWFKHRGVVSGLDFKDIGKGTSCKPYEFQPCAHHVDPGASGYPECPSGAEYPTPKCENACTDANYNTVFDDDKRYAKDAYSLHGVANIQKDMMEHGPVTAAFSVYSDFLTYQGGVYQRTKGSSFMGGHAVKIIGWGTDKETGVDYWTVLNSWNESWGEQGTFRILRGSNHCGIEGEIVAGEA
eukprot:TRINITY_DN31101_c0_g1_i1.p1 TRINITY_DN31101_c0_g1~~TRINITY_DN31101_c0_g1_i1.p1  ORF type:complete len:530 (-),score=188.22 TRINITY_DN31101_c0_g1_i1:334-1923(-)